MSTEEGKNTRWWSWAALLAAFGGLAVGFLASTACVRVVTTTVVQECDMGPIIIQPEPKHAQALIVVDLGRSSANLVPTYSDLIAALNGALAAGNIKVDEMAVLPLYGGVNGEPKLVYGVPAANAGTPSAVLIPAATSGNFDAPLTGVTAESNNLAWIASRLDTATLPPELTDGSSRPFFGQPKDLFLIVTITPSPQLCGLADTACALNGVAPEVALSTTATDGTADWLKLAMGTAYKPSQIFQIFITTGEGEDSNTFQTRCAAYPGFPKTLLDVMRPSPVPYYHDLAIALKSKGIWSAQVDMCEALGANGPSTLKNMVLQLITGT